MYLRYRLDEQGKRVYTFKVSRKFKLSNLFTFLSCLISSMMRMRTPP